MELNADYWEGILQRQHSLGCPKKVTGIDSRPAVRKGENYASDTRRVRLTVQFESGVTKELSIITKEAPESDLRREFIGEVGLFYKEIKIYKDVLPAMESLLSSSGDEATPPWPTMIHHRGLDLIVLTDLGGSGFRMLDRTKGLDFDHCALVMGALAKFHALSVVMKDKGMLEVDEFDKYILAADHPIIEDFFQEALTHTSEIITSSWEPEWHGIAQDLLNIDYILARIKETGKAKKEDFNVLIHGDAWTNNILYKYCPYTGRVIDVRLIDFQLAHHGSLALDLVYFLYTSAERQVRLKSDDLLQVYYKTLVGTLQLHHLHPSNLPTLEEVKAEVEEKAFYGVILALTFLYHALLGRDTTSDVEESEEFNEVFKSDLYVDAAKDILRPFLGTHFFKCVTS